MGMGFGDHLVADDVEHGAAGKSQGKGQNRRGHGHRSIAQDGAHHFDEARAQGQQECPLGADTRRQHGSNDHHALRNILQGDTACDQQRLSVIAGAKADTGGNAFRQIVDGNGGDEEQHLAQLSVAGMRLIVGSRQPVQMGHQFVCQVQTYRTGKNTGDGDEQAPIPAVFQGRQDQAQYRGSQHDTGSKAQHDVAEFVG